MLKISKKGRKSIPYDENQNSSMTQFQRQFFIFYCQNDILMATYITAVWFMRRPGGVIERTKLHHMNPSVANHYQARPTWWSLKINSYTSQNQFALSNLSIFSFIDFGQFEFNIKQLNVLSEMNLERQFWIEWFTGFLKTVNHPSLESVQNWQFCSRFHMICTISKEACLL